jgi:peptide/nickel transport system substrate-binding protein
MNAPSMSWILAAGLVLVGAGCASSQGANQPPADATAEREARLATGKDFPSEPADPAKVKKGGVLRGTWTGTFAHMDMHQTGNLGTWNGANLMYNGLLEWDAFDTTQQKMQPGIAASWEASTDGTRFTFKLRPNLRFHDGVVVKAEDAAFSLNRIIFPPREVASARKEQFGMVDKVEAGGDTVTVTTKFPSSNLLGLLADTWQVVVPKHVVEQSGDLKQVAVGTGPYKFKEFVPSQRFVATRNPDYFKPGLPYLDGVELYFFAEETTRIAALLTSQLDMVNPAGQGLTAQGAKDVKARGTSIIVGSTPRLAFDAWRFNVTRAPLDNVKVRQALNLALDRTEYVKFLSDFEGVFGTAVFPGSYWDLPSGDQEKLVGYGGNYEDKLKQSKQLLGEAGISNLELTLMGPTGVAFDDSAQAIESLLGKVGVKIKRDPSQQEEARNKESKGQFDIYSGGYGIPTIDPGGVYGEHYHCASPRNTSRWCDKEADALYEQQLKLLNNEERRKVVWEMNRRATNAASMGILAWRNEAWARWPYVKDWVVTPSRYTLASKLEYVWLDK